MSRKIRILFNKVNKLKDKCNDRKQIKIDFRLEIENIQKGVKDLKIETLATELRQTIRDEINSCFDENMKNYQKSILPYRRSFSFRRWFVYSRPGGELISLHNYEVK